MAAVLSKGMKFYQIIDINDNIKKNLYSIKKHMEWNASPSQQKMSRIRYQNNEL